MFLQTLITLKGEKTGKVIGSMHEVVKFFDEYYEFYNALTELGTCLTIYLSTYIIITIGIMYNHHYYYYYSTRHHHNHHHHHHHDHHHHPHDHAATQE
jgi:ABC-type nickel/cobalt efflux system permease component RcnA